MSKRKLPADAFEHYFALGPERSYQAVADRFGSSKTAVANLAATENWPELVRERELQLKESAAKKALETLEEMNERHVKLLKLVQKKAIEALRSYPLTTAMEAVRSLEMAIRNERLILGEPTDRSALNVEEIIRREHQRWLMPAEPEGRPAPADGPKPDPSS